MISLYSAAIPMLRLPFFWILSACSMEEQPVEKKVSFQPLPTLVENEPSSQPPRDLTERRLAKMKPFDILNLKKGIFTVGKGAWNSTKAQYIKCYSPRLEECREIVQHLDFSALIDIMKDFPISAAVAVDYPKAFAELKLSCLVTRSTLALYLVLSHYSRMVLELRLLVNEVWEATPYARLKLVKFKNLLKDVICTFNFTEALIKVLHGREDARYERKAVLHHLAQQFYVSNERITYEKDKYVHYIKDNFNSTITLYEYIVVTSRYYIIYFSNIYSIVQAHLDEREDKHVVKQLNRHGLKSKSSPPTYDLTSCQTSAVVKELWENVTPNKIFQLNEMLEEDDRDGPAGLKTRRFFKVVCALNELGFFRPFMTDHKTIRIKIKSSPVAPNGLVTKLQTRDISNGQKDGINENKDHQTNLPAPIDLKEGL